jgi:hypothetical protein
MRITSVLVKLLFRHVENFKMEHREAMKFRVKSKKTVTETSEMLETAYGEECLSTTTVSEWHSDAKIAGENNVACILYAKRIIHHESMPEKDCKR